MISKKDKPLPVKPQPISIPPAMTVHSVSMPLKPPKIIIGYKNNSIYNGNINGNNIGINNEMDNDTSFIGGNTCNYNDSFSDDSNDDNYGPLNMDYTMNFNSPMIVQSTTNNDYHMNKSIAKINGNTINIKRHHSSSKLKTKTSPIKMKKNNKQNRSLSSPVKSKSVEMKKYKKKNKRKHKKLPSLFQTKTYITPLNQYNYNTNCNDIIEGYIYNEFNIEITKIKNLIKQNTIHNDSDLDYD